MPCLLIWVSLTFVDEGTILENLKKLSSKFLEIKA